MKIRYILPNDKPDTIEAHKKLILEANPDCEIDGININPLKKNDQREGEFEVDLIVKHKDEKLVENAIKEGLKQAQAQIKQLQDDKVALSKERDSVIKERDKAIKDAKNEQSSKN